MVLAPVICALASIVYAPSERSLLFASTPQATAAPREAPYETPVPTAEPANEDTTWSPHAAPATCTAGVDTSPSCPYNTVGDGIKICPSDFPTFTPSEEQAPSCEVAVIGAQRHAASNMHVIMPHAHDTAACVRAGAGTGGLYTALRLVDTETVNASAICIFEMTGRVGGRIMSLRGLGPDQDLVVDVGAYRTWPQYTPIAHALITTYLELPVHCYDPGDIPCAKFNIATAEGAERKAGFAAFVEEMMGCLVDAGARWFPNYELKATTQASASADKQLTFGNGAQAVASKLILNMPQRPLLKVLRASSLPTGALDGESFEALHTVATEIVSKVYLYYSDAWWVNQFGLTSGTFELSGDATNMEVKGRYHDGDVKCDANGQNCHGFLQATYAHDFAGASSMYLRRFQNDRESPATIIGNADPEGVNFLQHAHDRVIYYHQYAGAASDDRYTAYEVRNLGTQTPPPEFAVIAHWNIATPGAGGGWHGWTNLDHTNAALDPLGTYGIHLVNEAFSFVQGWAEGSLQQADSVLQSYFGVEHPWGDLDVTSELSRVVRETAMDCEAAPPPAGGDSSSDDSSGGGTGGSPLCFTGNARLQLANGSLVPLRDAQKGDRVWTGDGHGTVTEALTHTVGGVMEVAVLATPHGELVGTTNHPVRIGGEWREIAAAHADGLLSGVVFEERFVDALYNLEIDGGAPGASAHAYVVNGVVASGLGDNEALNLAFPRQESWKAEKARITAVDSVDEKWVHAKAAAPKKVNASRADGAVGACPSALMAARVAVGSFPSALA